jgi:glutamate-1-semialdehyde 2,1-aminomutase
MNETTARRRTARSAALYEEAARHLAGGVGSGTRSPRSGWLPLPIFVKDGSGSRLTDVDGNTYIDYAMGLGPLILGHRPHAVIEAVTRQINERGSMFALAHDLEGQAAAAVAERIPSIDVLRFGNSGTECVQYALRFARAFTGREKVLRFEGHYHGWSDAIHWSAHPSLEDAGSPDAPNVVPGSSGMPGVLAETLIVCRWNDVDAIEGAFSEHSDEIAAVITEPILGNGGGIMPEAGYLERLRELTRESGALLIFDEVLTGFRVDRESGQGLLGVVPDLTVLAKALGAGFPVAAVGGRREFLDLVSDGRTMHGGTYNSSPLVCAAVLAAMSETGEPGFYDELNARGERLARGLVDAAQATGLEACWAGVGSLFQLWFAAAPPRDYREALGLTAKSPFPTLYAEFLDRGVIIQPPQEGLFLISAAHTDDDVDQTLAIASEVMPLVARAAAEGRIGPSGGVR